MSTLKVLKVLTALGSFQFVKQPEVLARFLASSSYIVTLDSFFSSILRSGSLELGLEPDFLSKKKTEREICI